MLSGDTDMMDEAYAPRTHTADAVLNGDVTNDTMLSRNVLDVRIRPHIHARYEPTSMPEGVTSDERLYSLPSILSSQGGPSVSGMHDVGAILHRDFMDDLPEIGSDMSYASWKNAPWNRQQLPKMSSATEMTEAVDHQDNVTERIPLTRLPMLEQHQIMLEDGSIETYFALPRDFATESQAGPGKHSSPYNSLSCPQVTRGGVDATNMQEEFMDNGFQAQITPHSGAINLQSRKHGLLHSEKERREKRSMGLERADNVEFERIVQREWEDLSCAIADANRACEECQGLSALSLTSQKGMDFDTSRDYLHLHDDEHTTVEELSEHVYKAFMHYVKILNENPHERSRLEKQGKGGTLFCLACKRFSKPYLDTHSLVMHTFMSRKRGLRAEHLGLRKAICTVMGWSATIEPSFGKKYQVITSEEAKMNKEDLILWPPALVVHNAFAKERSDNGARDAAESAVEDLFKEAGLSNSGIEVVVGNVGSLLVEYSPSSSCLLEAVRLHLNLAAKGCGRDAWVHKSAAGGHLESMPRGRRVLYGYLACAHDLHLVDRDYRRRCRVLSRERVSAFSSLA